MPLSILALEVFGWYGAIAIVGAYFLNSFNYLPTQSVGYQLLNLTGSLGIVLISFKKQTYQPFALNLVRASIALAALIQLCRMGL